MDKIFLTHPATLEQREVSSAEASKLIEEQGFEKSKHSYVSMFHPGMNKEVFVPRRDMPTWEARGYYAEPTWIFSPSDGSKMVSAEEAKSLYGRGWYPSPADFPKGGSKAAQEASKPEVKGAK